MNIPKSGLSGPVLNFANAVQSVFDRMTSVRQAIFNTTADLPNATIWEGRTVIVRNIGSSQWGKATALAGVWRNDRTGATIA